MKKILLALCLGVGLRGQDLTATSVTQSFQIFGKGQQQLAVVHEDGAVEITGKCEDILLVVRDSILQASQLNLDQYQERIRYEDALKREVDLLNNVIAAQKRQIKILQDGLNNVRRILSK